MIARRTTITAGLAVAALGLGADQAAASDTLRIQTLGGNDKVEVGDIWDLITPVIDLGADE